MLHELRLRGFADTASIAGSVGLSSLEVEKLLVRYEQERRVRSINGEARSWTLTSQGRVENERLLAEEIDALGIRSNVVSIFERFIPLNREMLEICTRWQLHIIGDVEVVNDHADLDYDLGVISALDGLDAMVQPLCASLAGLLERFGSYGSRFSHALKMVHSGRTDWFAKPGIDSYHSVWFELHENLLATLGMQRGDAKAVLVESDG